MRNKLKQIKCLWLLLLCFTLFSSLLYAAPTEALSVYDYANVLSSDEISRLEQTIATLKNTYNMDIGIVTITDAQGYSSQYYADEFLVQRGYGLDSSTNGCLLLLDFDNRQIYISTFGTGIKYITDARRELLIDTFYSKIKDQEYFSAFTTFLSRIDGIFEAGIPTTIEAKTSLPKKALTLADKLLRIGISALIALVVSVITFFSVKHSYKNPSHKIPPTIPERDSIDFTHERDQFLRTHTHRVKIPKDPPPGSGDGGGSSTHNHGGGSFGGGGRSF